ncbi:Type I restriction modification DNA specificity domain protein [Limihaloglobus sulfuriphilus]|uniref:Type I restriction modification DNA specificity domain protein n=2 Tax=Limihaloglobus sulfuriphilus TaxID=1851148 RepID=A0A1Q2MDJ0_9BACT|nr:Type I restriction modification DNA specificity domain protein [Limihaloglobus sulfuriphilus]
MQELLTGKKRLPGFEKKKGYKQTEIGVIPEDWDVKQLGELFDITSSKRVFQSEWKSQGIPFYRARELAVLGECGTVQNELFISEEMYRGYKKVYGVPKPGDMLVTGVGTLGKTYVALGDHEFYFKDGNIIWFKNSGKVSADYLKQLYLTKLITKQIEDASAGTTVGTYTITGAKKTIIPFPLLGEQNAIARVLNDMDSEIETLEQKRDKYKSIKQGMMQELLTGKTRLV